MDISSSNSRVIKNPSSSHGSKIKKISLWLIIPPVLYLLSVWGYGHYKIISDNPTLWQKQIERLVNHTSSHKSEENTLLFVGSSSIRLFHQLDRIMTGWTPIRHGFGGAKIRDAYYYREKLIYHYNPKLIVLYLGANDIMYSSLTLRTITNSYQLLIDDIQQQRPNTPIAIVALRPIANTEKQQRFTQFNQTMNNQINKRHSKQVFFIDANRPLANNDTSANEKLLRFDGLHLTQKGYNAWGLELKQQIDTFMRQLATNKPIKRELTKTSS